MNLKTRALKCNKFHPNVW